MRDEAGNDTGVLGRIAHLAAALAPRALFLNQRLVCRLLIADSFSAVY